MTVELTPGLVHRQTIIIEHGLTVPALAARYPSFGTMPEVFATAFMVGFVEFACIELLHPLLDVGQGSVGVHVDLSHVAATPPGLRVTADVELTAIEGRILTFRVVCRDSFDVICEGTHKRALIDRSKFDARVSAKAARAI